MQRSQVERIFGNRLPPEALALIKAQETKRRRAEHKRDLTLPFDEDEVQDANEMPNVALGAQLVDAHLDVANAVHNWNTDIVIRSLAAVAPGSSVETVAVQCRAAMSPTTKTFGIFKHVLECCCDADDLIVGNVGGQKIVLSDCNFDERHVSICVELLHGIAPKVEFLLDSDIFGGMLDCFLTLRTKPEGWSRILCALGEAKCRSGNETCLNEGALLAYAIAVGTVNVEAIAPVSRIRKEVCNKLLGSSEWATCRLRRDDLRPGMDFVQSVTNLFPQLEQRLGAYCGMWWDLIQWEKFAIVGSAAFHALVNTPTAQEIRDYDGNAQLFMLRRVPLADINLVYRAHEGVLHERCLLAAAKREADRLAKEAARRYRQRVCITVGDYTITLVAPGERALTISTAPTRADGYDISLLNPLETATSTFIRLRNRDAEQAQIEQHNVLARQRENALSQPARQAMTRVKDLISVAPDGDEKLRLKEELRVLKSKYTKDKAARDRKVKEHINARIRSYYPVLLAPKRFLDAVQRFTNPQGQDGYVNIASVPYHTALRFARDHRYNVAGHPQPKPVKREFGESAKERHGTFVGRLDKSVWSARINAATRASGKLALEPLSYIEMILSPSYEADNWRVAEPLFTSYPMLPRQELDDAEIDELFNQCNVDADADDDSVGDDE